MNKSKFTLFTASLALATALTFSCSSDDGDGNEDGLSSGGTEISSSSSTDNDGSSSGGVIGGCSDITYGTDSFMCGGQTYKTVVIGTQTWMAENLNYQTASGSWCYDDDDDNCDLYGRLYTWDAAMDACASGWHLPSDAEWDKLVTYAGGAPTAGTKLKATYGWGTGNGTDNYGFSAMPGGPRTPDGNFDGVGSSGNWWSATEYSVTVAYCRYMFGSVANVDGYYKTSGSSVRCLKD